MNYYPHHIGDFNNATRHLSRIERSVYRDLIEFYYDAESPLIDDFELICRKIIARSEEERTAVEQVLNEFFTLVDGCYVNSRCQKVIDDYQESIHNKSKAGKASARARKSRKVNKKSELTGVEQAFNSCSQPVTSNQEPKPKPITNNNKHTHTIPPDFTLTDDMHNQAVNFFCEYFSSNEHQGADTELIFGQFKAHYLSTDFKFADWEARWMVWCKDTKTLDKLK